MNLSNLPVLCLEKIFLNLNDKELDAVKTVSKQFYTLSKRSMYNVRAPTTNGLAVHYLRPKVFVNYHHYQVVLRRFRIHTNSFKDHPDFPDRYAESLIIHPHWCVFGQEAIDTIEHDLSLLKVLVVEAFVLHSVRIDIYSLLVKAPIVTQLSLPRIVATKQVMDYISGMTHLKHLNMSSATLATDVSTVTFPASLTWLDISYTRFPNIELYNLTNLRHLNLRDSNLKTHIPVLSALHLGLDSLNISWNTPIKMLKTVCRISSLTSLHLSMLDLSSVADIVELSSLTNLQKLEMDGCMVSSHMLSWLGPHIPLKVLDLSYNKLDSRCVPFILKCQQSLNYLDIGYNVIDDSGGQRLAEYDWKQLKSLIISNNYVTCKSAKDLSSMHLDFLDLSRNWICDSVVNEILENSNVKHIDLAFQGQFIDSL